MARRPFRYDLSCSCRLDDKISPLCGSILTVSKHASTLGQGQGSEELNDFHLKTPCSLDTFSNHVRCQVNPRCIKRSHVLLQNPALKENKKPFILETNTNGHFPGTPIRVAQVTHPNVETCREVFIVTEPKKDINQRIFLKIP